MNVIEAKTQILEILEANPRKVNPRIAEFCRYSNVSGTRHCIVGWIAENNGWRVPPSYYCAAAPEAADNYGWPIEDDVVEVLTEAQMVADKETVSGGNWGRAAKRLRKDWAM